MSEHQFLKFWLSDIWSFAVMFKENSTKQFKEYIMKDTQKSWLNLVLMALMAGAVVYLIMKVLP